MASEKLNNFNLSTERLFSFFIIAVKNDQATIFDLFIMLAWLVVYAAR
jgi:hypothetical protein